MAPRAAVAFGPRATSKIQNMHFDRLAIVGMELSRLSRCNKAWHQPVDVCGIFNTLLCDQDGVYDSTDGNDRLLLGMKGAMSEIDNGPSLSMRGSSGLFTGGAIAVNFERSPVDFRLGSTTTG